MRVGNEYDWKEVFECYGEELGMGNTEKAIENFSM